MKKIEGGNPNFEMHQSKMRQSHNKPTKKKRVQHAQNSTVARNPRPITLLTPPWEKKDECSRVPAE